MAVMVDDGTALRAAIDFGVDHPKHRGTGRIAHVKVETAMQDTRQQIGQDQKYGHNPAQCRDTPHSKSDPIDHQ
ncbi:MULTISPECIES: hypothetical protein [unclassified Bradyrhizobium]|uniref:hypothetical protein n=1 Tax=unclassified Bradyrhizobium TaxID=2631580 RepID=UPI0012E35705|nr:MULTISPECIES: hypothetical protein [unclassified Bradyrhizobium]